MRALAWGAAVAPCVSGQGGCDEGQHVLRHGAAQLQAGEAAAGCPRQRTRHSLCCLGAGHIHAERRERAAAVQQLRQGADRLQARGQREQWQATRATRATPLRLPHVLRAAHTRQWPGCPDATRALTSSASGTPLTSSERSCALLLAALNSAATSAAAAPLQLLLLLLQASASSSRLPAACTQRLRRHAVLRLCVCCRASCVAATCGAPPVLRLSASAMLPSVMPPCLLPLRSSRCRLGVTFKAAASATPPASPTCLCRQHRRAVAGGNSRGRPARMLAGAALQLLLSCAALRTRGWRVRTSLPCSSRASSGAAASTAASDRAPASPTLLWPRSSCFRVHDRPAQCVRQQQVSAGQRRQAGTSSSQLASGRARWRATSPSRCSAPASATVPSSPMPLCASRSTVSVALCCASADRLSAVTNASPCSSQQQHTRRECHATPCHAGAVRRAVLRSCDLWRKRTSWLWDASRAATLQAPSVRAISCCSASPAHAQQAHTVSHRAGSAAHTTRDCQWAATHQSARGCSR
jgi:hypothetical protein